MMNLSARAPWHVSSSTALESPGKKNYGSQNPWSAKAEKYDRLVQPVVDRDANELMDDRTEQPVVASWAKNHKFQSSVSRPNT